MDNFFAYAQKLELLAFFSGYPLIYAIIFFIAGNEQSKNNFKRTIISLLPFAYALVGTLYLVLQFKNLYPDYSFEKIRLSIQHPYLMTGGLHSILFWIPALAEKTALSLLHSLVFFFFVIRDLALQLSGSIENDIVRNDMKIYTASLLLNFVSVALLSLLSFLYTRYKKYKIIN